MNLIPEEELINAGIVIGLTIFLLFILKILRKYLGKLFTMTSTDLDNLLFEALIKPVIVLIIGIGVYTASLQISFLDDFRKFENKAFVAFLTLVGFWILIRILSVLLSFYQQTISLRTKTPIDEHFIPLIQAAIKIGIWVITFLLVLDQLGYKITPLIGGLGLGGLAVALALQDTLSNFFAGFYMMVDKPVKKGDYVKLESGEEGFVEEIGWRSTKIRPLNNNLFIIPNAKIAQTVITNCYLPSARSFVYINCGVGYNSDLEKVEKVTIEVAKEIQKTYGEIEDFEPLVRYKEFGDSNINFIVILQVKEYINQYIMQHEFIKSLFKRYNEEGIEISFPKRDVIFLNELKLQSEK